MSDSLHCPGPSVYAPVQSYGTHTEEVYSESPQKTKFRAGTEVRTEPPSFTSPRGFPSIIVYATSNHYFTDDTI